jgi:hypothetical protein
MSFIFSLIAAGWAQTVQGKNVSQETKDRQRFEFWLLLTVLYVGEASMFVIVYFFGNSIR